MPVERFHFTMFAGFLQRVLKKEHLSETVCKCYTVGIVKNMKRGIKR